MGVYYKLICALFFVHVPYSQNLSTFWLCSHAVAFSAALNLFSFIYYYLNFSTVLHLLVKPSTT
jgi:hypothetical protein